MSSLARLRKFGRLSGSEKLFVAEAVAVVAGFKLAMRIVPMRKLLAVAAGSVRSRPGLELSTPPISQAIRWAYLLMRASELVPSALCLNQALALQWMLGRRGCATDLEVGVAKQDSQFKAHAWLCYREVTILGGANAADEYRNLMRSATRQTPRAG
jgi:Transglutaminase-like superfamily